MGLRMVLVGKLKNPRTVILSKLVTMKKAKRGWGEERTPTSLTYTVPLRVEVPMSLQPAAA
jgi:hypothetical protein